MTAFHVRLKNRVDRAVVSAALAAGWSRVAFAHGKGTMADRIGVSEKCINRALTGENTPELVAAINSLLVDPTALDEALGLVGFRAVQVTATQVAPMELAAGTAGVLRDMLARLGDLRLSPRELGQTAAQLRPLMAQMQTIIAADDSQRAAKPVVDIFAAEQAGA